MESGFTELALYILLKPPSYHDEYQEKLDCELLHLVEEMTTQKSHKSQHSCGYGNPLYRAIASLTQHPPKPDSPESTKGPHDHNEPVHHASPSFHSFRNLPSSMDSPRQYYSSANFLSISSSLRPIPLSMVRSFAACAFAPLPAVSGVAASIMASRAFRLCVLPSNDLTKS